MVVNHTPSLPAKGFNPPWNPQFLATSPMFEPLRPVASGLSNFPAWPTLNAFQQLATVSHNPPATQSGLPIRFVPQGPKPEQFSDKYEPRIYLTGEVQTRTENWHDLFNTLAWLAFPETKAVINARHYVAFREREASTTGKNRGAMQDAYTLFDESGVIVICSDDSLMELLKNCQWKELFWQRRHDTMAHMKFILFGHSLYEKALQPYIGMTGKGLILKVDDVFLAQPIHLQVAELDRRVAELFSNPQTITTTRDFYPVPLLGMPGWTSENESEQYYDNAQYFRPARMAK